MFLISAQFCQCLYDVVKIRWKILDERSACNSRKSATNMSIVMIKVIHDPVFIHRASHFYFLVWVKTWAATRKLDRAMLTQISIGLGSVIYRVLSPIAICPAPIEWPFQTIDPPPPCPFFVHDHTRQIVCGGKSGNSIVAEGSFNVRNGIEVVQRHFIQAPRSDGILVIQAPCRLVVCRARQD
jgi:hypothetical protein